MRQGRFLRFRVTIFACGLGRDSRQSINDLIFAHRLPTDDAPFFRKDFEVPFVFALKNEEGGIAGRLMAVAGGFRGDGRFRRLPSPDLFLGRLFHHSFGGVGELPGQVFDQFRLRFIFRV
ncbi:MAG: hypothetical protein U1D30_04985 [Planctomycetota bacterium]